MSLYEQIGKDLLLWASLNLLEPELEPCGIRVNPSVVDYPLSVGAFYSSDGKTTQKVGEGRICYYGPVNLFLMEGEAEVYGEGHCSTTLSGTSITAHGKGLVVAHDAALVRVTDRVCCVVTQKGEEATRVTADGSASVYASGNCEINVSQDAQLLVKSGQPTIKAGGYSRIVLGSEVDPSLVKVSGHAAALFKGLGLRPDACMEEGFEGVVLRLSDFPSEAWSTLEKAFFMESERNEESLKCSSFEAAFSLMVSLLPIWKIGEIARFRDMEQLADWLRFSLDNRKGASLKGKEIGEAFPLEALETRRIFLDPHAPIPKAKDSETTHIFGEGIVYADAIGGERVVLHERLLGVSRSSLEIVTEGESTAILLDDGRGVCFGHSKAVATGTSRLIVSGRCHAIVMDHVSASVLMDASLEAFGRASVTAMNEARMVCHDFVTADITDRSVALALDSSMVKGYNQARIGAAPTALVSLLNEKASVSILKDRLSVERFRKDCHRMPGDSSMNE